MHTNALAKETSPYLLQHAHNPVNWFPWGDEAFTKARLEDKPIFLSVGYSACHWCHVMERESFEDEDLARLLNEHFVSIKVDKEERPDIDEIYMAAVQILTQQGGWPMSIFLAPNGKPFFGGTYFPLEDRSGRAGLKTVLRELARLWNKRRADVLKDAEQLGAAVQEQLTFRLPAKKPLDENLLVGFVGQLFANFDEEHGGFGFKPKFPPSTALTALLYFQKHLPDPDPRIKNMILRTLDQMSWGGIHDHLGGGFHRYSTDERWLAPHFEKMLYDNALLAQTYAEASVAFPIQNYEQIARTTYDWVLREMTSPEGAFYSAMDADSEGQEGKFYLWTKKEVAALLNQDSTVFSAIFNIKEEGNFQDEAPGMEAESNILHLTEPWANRAARLRVAEPVLRERIGAWKTALLTARSKRVRPAIDEKILTFWNALMIASLARGAVLLNEPRYEEAAARAAEFLLRKLRATNGRWLATHRNGQSRFAAYLNDHAALALAFTELYDATGEAGWKNEALAVANVMNQYFADVNGGYFFTPSDHEKLLARAKNALDEATPSGNGLAAQALIRLHAITGDKQYKENAFRIFAEFQGIMERLPEATASLHLAFAQANQSGQPI
jgi:uncharacterized protein YyaL (SSP411 family)